MDKKLACVGQAILALRFRLSLALLATLVTASEFGPVAAVPTASILGTTTFQAPTLRVWAAVSVDRPIFGIDQAINVTFAATNLGDVPIRLTALREDTVLLINGKEWPGSAFTFANGAHSTAQFLPAGKSTLFTYQLTSLFKMPGLYRILWRGKDFETLPVEFRVAANPF